MAEEFKREIALFQARQASRRPGVFLGAIHKKPKTFAPDSIPAWLLEMADDRDAAADVEAGQGRAVAGFGPERPLAVGKGAEICISREGPMNRASLEIIKERPILKDLPAFKAGRVYKIPEALISRPTPGILAGLDRMSKLVGPGLARP
jgi:iron complex transport system substrate-binding protein